MREFIINAAMTFVVAFIFFVMGSLIGAAAYLFDQTFHWTSVGLLFSSFGTLIYIWKEG